ncbi:hypothetical protein BASA81_003813 [Batrachochytrium salamandrivorans]|nr:hypothetical protein BASA81_003813 [Batrachochytrium salamandrivorans]
MVFTRFVEIGRVAVVNYGPDAGKLCVIVNVLTLNRVLIDGPMAVTGVARQAISTKRLTLTDLTVKVGLEARAGSLIKAFAKEDILNKYASSKEGKRAAVKKVRAEATDFERFQLMVARRTRAKAVNAKLAALRKAAA